jgi:hypothetical protein
MTPRSRHAAAHRKPRRDRALYYRHALPVQRWISVVALDPAVRWDLQCIELYWQVVLHRQAADPRNGRAADRRR